MCCVTGGRAMRCDLREPALLCAQCRLQTWWFLTYIVHVDGALPLVCA